MKFNTEIIHSHGFKDEVYGAFIPPIYLTAIFKQVVEAKLVDRGTELKYSREENPTVRALEKVLAKIEHGEDSLVFNSGMASISAVYFSMLSKGKSILLPMEIYGTTLQLAQDMEKFGVKVYTAWPETENIIEAVLDKKPDIVFIETLTNPMVRVIDAVELAKCAKETGSILIVDNTFATPILINPLKIGAKIVVHSLTKYISGHNDVLGGAIISDKETIVKLWDWRRKLGTIMQPFEAYMVLRGLKTLSVRFKKMCVNALAVSEFLAEHPKVEEVYYPGLKTSPYKRVADKIFKMKLYGSVLSFKIRGGVNEVRKALTKLSIVKPTPSFGGAETLITYPIVSASKHLNPEIRAKLGITENLLRLSVGLEDVEDIIEDLDKALTSI